MCPTAHLDARRPAPYRARPMIRVVLFDIDGTLIHTHGAGRRAFARAFADEFNLPHATDGVSFAGRTDHDIARSIFCAHAIAPIPAQFQRFYNIYLHWLQIYLADNPGEILPGVRELLAALAALPAPPVPALLTGNLQRGAELKLRSLQLWQHFTFGAYGDDVENRDAVAQLALQHARTALGAELAPSEILVIGDTPRDISCARAINARVLAVATGESTVAELAAHAPDLVLPTLTAAHAATLAAL